MLRKIVLSCLALAAMLSVAAYGQGVAPARKSLKVNGLNLSYLEWGSPKAQPMLLFTGAGSVGASWDPVAPELAKLYHVFAFDRLGQGYSDWDPNKQYSVMNHVANVKEATRQLGLEHIIVIGHSQGGNEAVVFTAENADHVAALIAEDGGFMLAGSTHAAMKGGDPKTGAPPRTPPPSEFATWDEVAAANKGKSQLELDARFKKAENGHYVSRSDPAAGALMEADSMMQPGATGPFAQRVKCPAMVIRGGDDKAFALENAQTLTSLIADTRMMVVVPGAGHGLHSMKPAEFTAAVKGFLTLIPSAK
jgi:pimeloyl-ACP methyl ester carboxylesterase